MICSGCHTDRPSTSHRPPRGWKVLSVGTLCPGCLAYRYQIRAITIPIAGPQDATWPELGAALREAWVETTRCANWIATELYARDVRREPDDPKLRSMPRVYLYPEARALFPMVSPINLTAILQQIEQTYRKRRYELLWQRSISLPTYRYPMPTPIHSQAWRLEETAGGQMLAHVRLGDRWWILRLRGGPEFMRQRAALRQLIQGTALPAAGALYAIRATRGDHRHAERQQRVMLKLVAWLSRVPRRSGLTATVQTAASDLLLVRVPDQGIVATIRADHVRRAIASHEVRRGRLQADLAITRRWIPSERAALQTRLTTSTDRQHRALRTWLQQIAAQVARTAIGHGCGTVVYEDEVQDFCQPFPWQALRLALQHACEGRGLRWQYASGQCGAEESEALAHGVSLEGST